MNTTPMAGLNQQLVVGAQKMPLNRHLRPIRQHELRMRAKLLDEAENVVPAPAVQPRGMVSQLVKDLVHLECRQNRFDQDSGANRSARNAQFVLGKTKHVVPQPRLQVTLHLRQVKIRASALAQQGRGIVKKEQAKIKQRRRDRLPLHQKVLFVQVPSSWPNKQSCRIGSKLILLSLRTLVLNRSSNRIAQIVLAVNIVTPGRRIRVLEVGHEHIGPRVQRIDDHLAIDRPGNFHAAIAQVPRYRGDLPVALADSSRVRQKVRKLAVIDVLLYGSPPRQQFLPPGLERSRKFRQKCAGFRGKNARLYLASGLALNSIVLKKSHSVHSQHHSYSPAQVPRTRSFRTSGTARTARFAWKVQSSIYCMRDRNS